MNRLLVLGALHYDVVVDAPRLPGLDETLVGSAVDYRFGGKGGNQAVMAAQFGARVSMAGRVGRDAPGAFILDRLDRAGVQRGGVLETDSPTGMSVAISDKNGDYGAVIVSGANLLNDGICAGLETFSHVLLQNEIPESANLALARSLPDDATLILNGAPFRELPTDLLERVDLLILNRVEACQMTGKEDVWDAVRALKTLRLRGFVVTLGDQGYTFAKNGENDWMPAPAVQVVSTHGAGDAFVGALAAELMTGAALKHALSFAQTAASRFVATPIAERSDLTREDVKQAMPHS
ncbi:Ribokinase [Candidatus Rhodobacter oscarellae]|uniref:Ribokinase n=1 Tax=Candidatus Rhodobacter oscarellae TaxID=1675527 RepID=A0A0J9EB79_9RHOB|nr:PfkB family carbohydrate kinase [Candidatus Rhodobacter lobularis]KMW58939.1 Ribokinase [Candidatus Rhodobacter lobularis]